MKRPPNIAVTGISCVLAFTAILLARYITAPSPPSPWRTDEAAAFAEARRDHKRVMIDFTEDWSVPSEELSNVLDELRGDLDEHFVPLRLDLTKADERSDAIRARYRITTTPLVLFVDGEGNVHGRIDRLVDKRAVRDVAGI